MPLPSPNDGETHDDWISRCMSNPVMVDEYSSEGQRYAVCQNIWESKAMSKKPISSLLKAVRNRKGSGYGITTAEPYVRRGCVEYQLSVPDEHMKRAKETLVFHNSGCEVENCCRKDMQSLLPEGIELPPHSLMVVRHKLTTPRVDRDRDVLRTEGARLDPKAPLLWQHMHAYPVGKVLTTIEHTKEVLRLASVLLDLNELTQDTAKLVEADVLRFSHGFLPEDWDDRKSEDDEWLGFDIIDYEIMEASFVSVPSNVDAEVEMWSRGQLESEMWTRHAKRMWDKRKKVHGGVDVDGLEAQTKQAVLDQKTGELLPAKVTEDLENAQAAASALELLKAGRVMSEANLVDLKEVKEDLQALAETELDRTQRALLERATSKLVDVLAKAEPETEEEEKTPVTAEQVWEELRGELVYECVGCQELWLDDQCPRCGSDEIITLRGNGKEHEVLEDRAMRFHERNTPVSLDLVLQEDERTVDIIARSGKEEARAQMTRPNTEDAMRQVLDAEPDQLIRLQNAISALLQSRKHELLAEEFRQLS